MGSSRGEAASFFSTITFVVGSDGPHSQQRLSQPRTRCGSFLVPIEASQKRGAALGYKRRPWAGNRGGNPEGSRPIAKRRHRVCGSSACCLIIGRPLRPRTAPVVCHTRIRHTSYADDGTLSWSPHPSRPRLFQHRRWTGHRRPVAESRSPAGSPPSNLAASSGQMRRAGTMANTETKAIMSRG
jgi:hypothetical protein